MKVGQGEAGNTYEVSSSLALPPREGSFKMILCSKLENGTCDFEIQSKGVASIKIQTQGLIMISWSIS